MNINLCKGIHDVLQKIFDKHINELYKTLANKDKWDDNIREFINYHENMNIIDIDISWLSAPEIDEIQEQGFQFFTGDKCANVDEDEFDGPNDLSIEETDDKIEARPSKQKRNRSRSSKNKRRGKSDRDFKSSGNSRKKRRRKNRF